MLVPKLTRIILILLICLLSAASAPAQDLNFTLPTLNGEKLSLKDFRGRVVILDFFATWCRPCVAAMPKLNELQKQYGDQGLSVIAFSVDQEGKRVVKPFVTKLGLDFPFVMGTTQMAQDLAQVKFLPTTLIIDPNGKVAARFEGYTHQANLLTAIKPYLTTNANSAPDSARTARLKPGDKRFKDLWVTNDEVFSGNQGLFVHAVVDVSDQNTYQGVWLELNLQPEMGRGEKRRVLAPVKKLYQRVDDPSKEYFILFVRCPQMPELPPGGFYRTWVNLIDGSRQTVEKSREFLMPAYCAGEGFNTASGVPSAPTTQQGDEAVAKQRAQDGGQAGGQGAGSGQTAATGQGQTPPAEDKVPLSGPATPPDKPQPAQRKTVIVEREETPPGKAEPGWEGGKGRLKRIWSTTGAMMAGKSGLNLHVDADLAGMDTKKPIWLVANMAADRNASGKLDLGQANALFLKVKNTTQGQYTLFISCDQMPPLAPQGKYRIWVQLVQGDLAAGEAKKELEATGAFSLVKPCQGILGSNK